ncbi:restriction endonuclease subunit S [Aquibacillus albus]|uniref:Type I restriction enzyme S subunit n=1 Tax=Aquibacillus albus TaxID=1168171 RepID=A0ABS2N0D1_9BACI|nr:restriction endonuclease subunit S [Aquibacillus albus]MBM7571574.1 type I restriction enzyme S subunit [Aquibacillus albus]
MSEESLLQLKDVAYYVKDRISTDQLSNHTYISTENMLTDKRGVEEASGLPSSKTVTKYLPNDILVSNIRPYFKKIWYANQTGGCSNDVLVLRNKLKERIDDKYLYYALFQDSFFDYVMSGAKGAKMPRGDKEEILKYKIEFPSITIQRKIAAILSAIDEKIELINKMNQTLEDLAFTLFKKIISENNSNSRRLRDYITLNPTTPVKKGTIMKYIDMKALSTNNMSVSYESIIEREFKSGSKFMNNDVLLARITPCLENGKSAFVNFLRDGELAYGSTEFLVLRANEKSCPQFLYCLIKDPRFKEFAKMSMVGSSGRQRIQNSILLEYEMPDIESERMSYFDKLTKDWFKLVSKNNIQNWNLTKLRDYLLPKLLSGEIRSLDVESQVAEVTQ